MTFFVGTTGLNGEEWHRHETEEEAMDAIAELIEDGFSRDEIHLFSAVERKFTATYYTRVHSVKLSPEKT